MNDRLLNLVIDMNNFIQQNVSYLPNYEKRVAYTYQEEIDRLVKSKVEQSPPLKYEGELHNADDKCDHYVTANWSGVSCKKCGGWFIA